ncbi:hypothetical protein JCM10908_004652 [Rhodotorula pacifica]|uniref:uncharacterized protein n=1 Tax=Rhodotorula pacifica TaxID=1495444 RepID=UPI003174D2FF
MPPNLALFRKFDGRAKLQQLQGNAATTGAHFLRPTFALPSPLRTLENPRVRNPKHDEQAKPVEKAASTPADALAPPPPAASPLPADPTAPPPPASHAAAPRGDADTGLLSEQESGEQHIESKSSVVAVKHADIDSVEVAWDGVEPGSSRKVDDNSRVPSRPEHTVETIVATSSRQAVIAGLAEAAWEAKGDDGPTATKGEEPESNAESRAHGSAKGVCDSTNDDVPGAAQDRPSNVDAVSLERGEEGFAASFGSESATDPAAENPVSSTLPPLTGPAHDDEPEAGLVPPREGSLPAAALPQPAISVPVEPNSTRSSEKSTLQSGTGTALVPLELSALVEAEHDAVLKPAQAAYIRVRSDSPDALSTLDVVPTTRQPPEDRSVLSSETHPLAEGPQLAAGTVVTGTNASESQTDDSPDPNASLADSKKAVFAPAVSATSSPPPVDPIGSTEGTALAVKPTIQAVARARPLPPPPPVPLSVWQQQHQTAHLVAKPTQRIQLERPNHPAGASPAPAVIEQPRAASTPRPPQPAAASVNRSAPPAPGAFRAPPPIPKRPAAALAVGHSTAPRKRARVPLSSWTPIVGKIFVKGLGQCGVLKVTGGQPVHVPLGNIPDREWLDSVPDLDQQTALKRVLEQNACDGGPNSTLRRADLGAVEISDYKTIARALNRSLLASSSIHQPPPTSSVNHKLARGLSDLTYYTYSIWSATRSVAASEAFNAFVAEDRWRRMAVEKSIDVYFKSWLGNLPATESDGSWTRKSSYVGWSDGFDHLPEHGGEPYWRLGAHFVANPATASSLNQFILALIAEFRKAKPELSHDIVVVASLLSSANNLDAEIALNDIMETEAIHSAAARSHTGTGGANCAPCGNMSADLVSEALALEPPSRPIGQCNIPYSIRQIVQQRHPTAITVQEVRDAAEQKKLNLASATAAKNESRQGTPEAPKEKSIRKHRYRHGQGRLRRRTQVPLKKKLEAKAKAAAASKTKPKSAQKKPAAAKRVSTKRQIERVKFTDAEDDEIRRLRKLDWTWQTIGLALTPTRDSRTVQRRWETLESVGKSYHVYTPEEDAAILKGRARNKSYQAIGQSLGLSKLQAQNRWRQLTDSTSTKELRKQSRRAKTKSVQRSGAKQPQGSKMPQQEQVDGDDKSSASKVDPSNSTEQEKNVSRLLQFTLATLRDAAVAAGGKKSGTKRAHAQFLLDNDVDTSGLRNAKKRTKRISDKSDEDMPVGPFKSTEFVTDSDMEDDVVDDSGADMQSDSHMDDVVDDSDADMQSDSHMEDDDNFIESDSDVEDNDLVKSDDDELDDESVKDQSDDDFLGPAKSTELMTESDMEDDVGGALASRSI